MGNPDLATIAFDVIMTGVVITIGRMIYLYHKN